MPSAVRVAIVFLACMRRAWRTRKGTFSGISCINPSMVVVLAAWKLGKRYAGQPQRSRQLTGRYSAQLGDDETARPPLCNQPADGCTGTDVAIAKPSLGGLSL